MNIYIIAAIICILVYFERSLFVPVAIIVVLYYVPALVGPAILYAIFMPDAPPAKK